MIYPSEADIVPFLKSLAQGLQPYAKANEVNISFSTGMKKKLSLCAAILHKPQILILDEIGLLADVYRYSSLAFIGGSFVSKVHSVMEPLCALNPVIVGPFYENNPEAVQFQKLNSVFTVSSTEQFLKTFNELAQSTQILKSHISANLKPFYGSTGQHIALINSQLLSSNSKYG